MRLRICWLLGLAVTLVSVAGCQKRASFDPALAGAFFPLRPGSSWTLPVHRQKLEYDRDHH